MKRCLLLVLCCFVAWPAMAQAQVTILTANTVEFTPSPDHAATRLDGSAVVTSYELNAVAVNSQGAIAITVNLGKPSPVNGKIGPIAVTQLTTITPNLAYTATVTAIGPDGRGVSPSSDPFGRAIPAAPAAPGKPVVR